MALIKNIKLPNQSEYPVAFFRGTCSTAAATAAKEVTCSYFEAADLVKGAIILVTFDYTNSGAVSSLTMNVNGTGAKPIKKFYASATPSNLTVKEELAANQTQMFEYDGTNWVCMTTDYNSDNAGYYDFEYYVYELKATDYCGKYRILFTNTTHDAWVPGTTSNLTNTTTARDVNQRPFDPFGRIVYYSGTAATADSALTFHFYKRNFMDLSSLGYTFNVDGSNPFGGSYTCPGPVFVKCAPQSDGSAIIDATTPLVQALPSSYDGKIYILLGHCMIYNSARRFLLYEEHPIYYYFDGAIREWTNQSMNLSKYNNDAGFITSSAIGTASLTIKGNNTTAATFGANATSGVNLNFAGSGGTTVTGASGTITISSPTTPNGFANVVVGSTTISADTSVDTLTLVAGTGISLTPDATNDKITITNTVTNTDTKNTAGATNTSSKIFLIGATSQAANPQTYSHDTAYVGTDGLLYSGSKVVATQEYVNGLVANAIHYIGDFNASTGAVTNSSTLTQLAEKVGDMFVVSTAGTYAGTALEVGDSIIFKKAVAAGIAPTATDITFVEATVSVSNSGPTLSTSAKTIGTVEGVALTASVDHVKTSITEKTSYPSGTTASANGGTITVRDVKVNAAGHVTGTQDRTITLSQTLPGSGTLTIKKNGTSVGTFSANASADTSVNITVPTKTSELTNDSGFLTSHQSLAALPKETFKTIKVGTTNVIADSSVDTLTLAGDSFITLTANATSDTISFAHKADLDATSTAGLFKFTHDEAGHITGTTAVAKADITALGIPGSDSNTKNTAGATPSTSKLFIVGAASQTTNPTTNTNASVYIDGSVLYSGGKKVATTDQIPTVNYPVTSVAGKTGAVTLDSLSIGTKPSTSGTATNNVAYNGNGAKGLYFSSVAASTTNVKFSVDNNGFVTGTVTDSGNTRNTVGATVSDSTIYLVGPTATGAASAQSYANASVYMSAGKLYSDKALVATQVWVTSQGYKTTDSDTKNTTGSNASTGKVYLVGAGSQTTGSNGVQTYSNTSVYMQNGKVYSNGAEVLTSHQSLSGYATETWVTNKGYQTAANVAAAINSSLDDLDASFTAGTNQAIAGIGQVNGKITTAKYVSIPQGTVTSVTISGTSPITVSSSSAITSSGSRTISHATSGVTAGTYNWGTVNATGHVTAANDVDTAVYWHELI